ncbi:MAG: ATP-dependent DNA helicase RecG [Holophagales bacterium]|jgi:ATP-dependent DNA helicase RecG|nr:ATP-dependent DNA helicase RecG [Holophagales bacterium]
MPSQLLPFSAKLTALRGVGSKRAELLADAGFQTVGDLLWGLPYRYVDRGSIRPIGELNRQAGFLDSSITLLGKIVDFRQSTTRIQRMTLTEALLSDEKDSIRLVWFNQPHLSRMLKPGSRILVWGPLSHGRHGLEMRSPGWEVVGRSAEDNGELTENIFARRFLSLYRRIGSLSGQTRQNLVSLALKEAEQPGAILPPELASGLPDTLTALRLLHNPSDDCSGDDLESGSTPAHQRLAAEELFAFALAVELRRSGRLKRQGEKIITSAELRDKLKSYLPFSLTLAQRRAFKEIVDDLCSGRVMHRMLQGDVGSGNTLVAFLAMAMAAETGGQAALLAPTEVLARQHAASFIKLLGDESRRLQLLIGAMRAADKRSAIGMIANGQADYVIGTHALFQESVLFKKLQIVVVDEQHRFGVKQREAIRDKGLDPHWLVMSATPIPRSLALSIFGDLDQSVLDELPPGRQPVDTRLVNPDHAERAWNLVDMELATGRQAFVVSPSIDPSDETKPPLRDIQAMEILLRARFPDIPLTTVHGRLKTDELNGRMSAFVSGEARILLATTVIEVGVDVPNATVMIVDHAERFGLSQLHQLRGRVGRGLHGGHFVMISKSETERLQILTETSDGFRIAQKDLEIRGPGEFFGTRQSGLPRFQAADFIRDRQLLLQCREAAVNTIRRGLTDNQLAWLRQEQSRLKLAEIG